MDVSYKISCSSDKISIETLYVDRLAELADGEVKLDVPASEYKYVGIEKIDPAMLRELIKAIYVEAPDKSSGKRRQNIHIQYDGIGFIPLDELMNQKETA